jgi:hypothetical protein
MNKTPWILNSRAFKTINILGLMILRLIHVVPEKGQTERSGLR